MSAFPIHHSSEHATGPGADPGHDHGKGQPTNRSCAQVGDAARETRTFMDEASSGTACVPPGSALWRERPCPRRPSWKLAATMSPWELRD